MSVEKLLLQVLIVLSPTFIYGLFPDKFRAGKSPLFYGILQGSGALACILFASFHHGVYWDLRYVPLMIAFLYGGPISGIIVVVIIIGMRTWMLAQGYVWFGNVVAVVVSIAFYMLSKKLTDSVPKRRVTFTLCTIGLLQLSVIGIFSVKILLQQDTMAGALDRFYLLAYTNAILFLAFAVTIALNEAIIEREVMRIQLLRAEKLQTLGELAASIAHEVRNPLTVVRGFLQLNQRRNTMENIPLMLDELKRAELIISDYLNFSKPQLNETELLDLSALLTDSMKLLHPLTSIKGLTIESLLEDHLVVETDRIQLQQAFVNILKNAIEATSHGGLITVVLKKMKDKAHIVITDTGKGMSTEQLSRLGTFFYTTEDVGTGLGLAVTFRIIELINGKISFKSKEKVGTEVIVELHIHKP